MSVFFGSPLQPAAKSKPISSFWFGASGILVAVQSSTHVAFKREKVGICRRKLQAEMKRKHTDSTVKQLPFQSYAALRYCNTVKYLFCTHCFSLGWSKNGFFFFFCVCFAAMHQALDTLSDSTSSTTANDLDLIFLKGIMESPVVMRSLFYTL